MKAMKASEELWRAWRRFESGSDPATTYLRSGEGERFYFAAMDVVPSTPESVNGESYREMSRARFRLALSMALSDEAGQ